MENKHFIFFALSAMLLTACAGDDKDFDATGTFEATEITVSAEQNGKIFALDIEEGNQVEKGKQVGLIDTVQLYLKARQIGATREVYAEQRPDIEKQIAATRQLLANARQERNRFAALVNEGAANQKQFDDADNAVRLYERQLTAQQSSLGNSTRSLDRQMSAADIQRWQVVDQLEKCHIKAPITGTILEKYAEAGEFATIGKPLFKIADIKRMYLRAYVTTAQLERVRVGQSVTVIADYGNSRKQYKGKVTWISARSEFTPKTILTDDERADLVYAVKIAIDNDGYVKIGMYGKVKF